jgi:phosphoribosylformylglycinamidine synthase PurS subunit
VDPTHRTVRIEVRVSLKPGVMDAEAESVEKALGLLAITPTPVVRTARIYELEFSDVTVEEARHLAQEAVDRLLANPVVHRVRLSADPE